jgi:hypothetical protein
MQKESFFNNHWGNGWPELSDLKACFLDPERRMDFFNRGLDGGSFFANGLGGTEGLPPKEGLISSELFLFMNPDHGAWLKYGYWDGRILKKKSFVSKGDLNRLGEFVRSFHGTPLSVGLFVPFEDGFRAVKEFIETEGEQPASIEWVASKDLPPETFPDP